MQVHCRFPPKGLEGSGVGEYYVALDLHSVFLVESADGRTGADPILLPAPKNPFSHEGQERFSSWTSPVAGSTPVARSFPLRVGPSFPPITPVLRPHLTLR